MKRYYSVAVPYKKYKRRVMKACLRPNPQNRYINIGAGGWYFPRWENIDLYVKDKFLIDYEIDLRKKEFFPIASETAALVFSSHVLEHMSDDACMFTLKESYRILKKGGVMRIVVPDMEKALHAYRNKDRDFFYSREICLTGNSLERRLVNFFASYQTANHDYRGGPIVPDETVRERVGSLSRYEFAKWCVSMIPESAPYKAHVNGYDFPKLKKILEEAGFRKITLSSYRQSSVTMFRDAVFDRRPKISLYVEAYK